MSTTEDEPSLNGRLRPRKSVACPRTTKTARKSDSKETLNKSKRTTPPSKLSPHKHDDLSNKSDFTSTPQFLCLFCEKRFGSQKTAAKHIHRIHLTQPAVIECLFCTHTDPKCALMRHMVECHPNQYFACLDCRTRFPSTSELAEHKLNVCDKLRDTYPKKLRKKGGKAGKKNRKQGELKQDLVDTDFQDGHGFNGIIISCELKPSQMNDNADIEDNITTNVILPSSKGLPQSAGLDKGAVIVLDEIQWNKRLPPNFSFNNADADQILSRLGVVHRSPRTGESTRRDCFKTLDNFPVKFEKCFDTTFYSKVASNVQENLAKFLDGSFNFNPDPDKATKTRKAKNSVVINTAEGFPILLACEQYSRNVFDGYMPRAIAPKHKWKWDSLEYEKPLMSFDQIKRDSHTNNCIITLVSSMDIWTQLRMRRRFEDKYGAKPIERKTEKKNIIGKELKEILESREIPSPRVTVSLTADSQTSGEFPATLGLARAAPAAAAAPAVLSGEWVRPRCYVCCACGNQTRDPRTLNLHISTHHPNAQVQHYEIVGEQLLNADILKHLYVPPSQVTNRTRPPRGFRECTKCQKSITLEELHQHMLECAGDTPAVRRRQARCRPFGVRKRRSRVPDTTARNKIRSNIRSKQRRQNKIITSRSKIRSEVGDAETIRKMLADLPAKRHRVLLNPIHKTVRPRTILNTQRNKIIMKKRSTEQTKNSSPRKSRLRFDKTAPNGDDNIEKNSSTQDDDDDEDNKPLKPRVKRPLNLRARALPKELPRPVPFPKDKRRSIRVRQKIAPLEPDVFNSDIQNISEKAIIPKRIDVNQGACNTKENTGCGPNPSNSQPNQRNDENREGFNARRNSNSNGSDNNDNREAQPPAGPSRPNGNDGDNNPGPPTPNTPLKHSIEKLTASNEKHDKSVQFHSSFLVNQSCYDTNHHDPSHPIALFESEAVASEIDKPPIRDKNQSEIHEVTKNKSGKPKKGLNDCIAMLMNKLVEPLTAGHVSVSCGSDEPISPLHLCPPQPISQEAMMVSPGSDYLHETVKNTNQSNIVEAEGRPIVQYDQANFAIPLPHVRAVERRYSTDRIPNRLRQVSPAEQGYSTNRTPNRSRQVSPAEQGYSTNRTPNRSRQVSPAEQGYSTNRTPNRSRQVSPAEQGYLTNRTPNRSRQLSPAEQGYLTNRTPHRSRQVSPVEQGYSTNRTPNRSCRVSPDDQRYSTNRTPNRSRQASPAEQIYSTRPSRSSQVSPAKRRYSTEQTPSTSRYVSPAERRYSTEQTPSTSHHITPADLRYLSGQTPSTSRHVSPAERRYSTEHIPTPSCHMPPAKRRYSTEKTPSPSCQVSPAEQIYPTRPSRSRRVLSAERRYSTEQTPSTSCHVSPAGSIYSTEQTPSTSRYVLPADRTYSTEQTPSTSRHVSPADRTYLTEQTPSTSRHVSPAERRYSTEQTPSTSRHVSPADRRYSAEQTPNTSRHMSPAERRYSTDRTPNTSRHVSPADRRCSTEQTPSTSCHVSLADRRYSTNQRSHHMPSAEPKHPNEQTPSTSRHVSPAEQNSSNLLHVPSAELYHPNEQTPITSRHVHLAEQTPGTSFQVPADRRYSNESTPSMSRRSSSYDRNYIFDVNLIRQRTSSLSSDTKSNLYGNTEYHFGKSMLSGDLQPVRTSDYGLDMELLLPKSIEVYRGKTPSARSPSSTHSGRSSVQSDCDRAYVSKPLSSTQLSVRSGGDIALDDHTIDKLLVPSHHNYNPTIEKMEALQKSHSDAEKNISYVRNLRYDQPVKRILAMHNLSYNKNIETIPAAPDAKLYSQQVLGMREYTYDQPNMLVYPDSLITPQNLADVRPEGELYRSFKAEMDLYAKARVRTVLPPTYENIDVGQDLLAPLDLSGKNNARRQESGSEITIDRFNDSKLNVVDLRVGTHTGSRNAEPSSTETNTDVCQSSSRVTRSSSQRTNLSGKVKYDTVEIMRQEIGNNELPPQTNTKPSASKDQLLVSVVKEGKQIDSTLETRKVVTSQNTLRVKPLDSLQSVNTSESNSIKDVASVQNLLTKSLKHFEEKMDKNGQDRLKKKKHYESGYFPDQSLPINAKTTPTNDNESSLNEAQSLQKPVTAVPSEYEHTSPVYTITNSLPKDNLNTTTAVTDTPKRNIAIERETPEQYCKENNKTEESKTNDTIMDPDTAKKIAMLPRELVEILGTMPVDHRNQLLNVLPQYVATTMTSPLSLPDTADTHTSTLTRNLEYKSISNNSLTTALPVAPLVKNAEKKITELTHNKSNTTTLTQSYLVSARCDKDIKTSQPVMVDNGKAINFCESEKNLVSKYKMPVNEHTTASIRLTGLIDDNINIDKVKEKREISCSLLLPLPAPPSFRAVEQSHRRKINNEQTASLRAVRIRTQSDKQKELLPLKDPSSDEMPKLVISEKKVANILIFKPHPTVQQAEITSTHQAKKKACGSNTLLKAPKPSKSISNDEKTNRKQSVTRADMKYESMLITYPEVVATTCMSQNKPCARVCKENISDTTVPTVSDKSDECPIPEKYTGELEKIPDPNVTTAQEFNIIEQNTVVTLPDKTDKKTNYDEADSEDDVSLAAIVKLKQRHTNIKLKRLSLKKMKKKRKITKPTVYYRKPNKKKDSNMRSNLILSEKKNDLFAVNHNNAIEALAAPSYNLPKEKTTVTKNSREEQTLEKQETDILIEQTSTVKSQVQKSFGKKRPSYIKIKQKKEKTSKKILSKQVPPHHTTPANEAKSSIKTITVRDLLTSSESKVSMSPDRIGESLMNATISGHNELCASKSSLQSSYVPMHSEVCESSTGDIILAPLRRSMRGKSLVNDDVQTESTIPPTVESVTDQKGPVTKKQLIFYKLSLDEEKLAVNISNSSVSQCLDSNISCINVHDIFDNKIEASDDCILQKKDGEEKSDDFVLKKRSVDDDAEQLSKPRKRKKSPSRRKPKKQKQMPDIPKPREIISMNMPKSNTCNEDATIDTPNINSGEHITELIFDRNYGADKSRELSCSFIGNRKQDVDNADSVSVKKCTVQNERLMNEKMDIVIETKSIPTGELDKSSKVRSTTCYDIPKAARQTRSKSTSAQASAVYDPYDIDLDDMIECEPLRKKFKSNSKTSRYIKPKSSKLKVTSAENVSVGTELKPTVSDPCNPCNSLQDLSEDTAATKTLRSNDVNINLNTDVDKPDTFSNIDRNQVNDNTPDATEENNTKKVIMSDSDDSSKSDVPLKKYVQNKKKKQPVSRKKRKNKSNVAKTKKSSKKKRIQSRQLKSVKNTKTSESVTVENESQKQLRSEQFMESFGFFSERKPRKSNLLASKKIAETFHSANESDHMFLKRITKKRQPNESKSKKKEKTVQKGAKSAKKRGSKQEANTKSKSYFCECCLKEFRRADNLMRHRMTFIHASNLPGFAFDFGPTHEKPNYCVAFKEQMDKFMALTESLKGENQSKVKLPTMQDLVADAFKAVRQQQLIARGLSVDEALFIDCCELLKESNSDTPKSEIGYLTNKKKICYGACKPPPKSDSDVDPITARSILESEEIKNLENDLISCFKEAAETVRRNMEQQQSASVTLESNLLATGETVTFSNNQNPAFDRMRKEGNENQQSETLKLEKYRCERVETVTSSNYRDPGVAQKPYDEEQVKNEKLSVFQREIIETLTSFNYHGHSYNLHSNSNKEQRQNAMFGMNLNFQDPTIGQSSYASVNRQQGAGLFFEKFRRNRIETVTSATYQNPSAQNSGDNEEDRQISNLVVEKSDNEDHHQSTSLTFKSNASDIIKSVAEKSQDNENHLQSASLSFESNVNDRNETVTEKSKDNEDRQESTSFTFESNVGDRNETIVDMSKDNECQQQTASLAFERIVGDRNITFVEKSKYDEDQHQIISVAVESYVSDRNDTVLDKAKGKEDQQQSTSFAFESNVGDRNETVLDKSKDNVDQLQSASFAFESNVGDRNETVLDKSKDNADQQLRASFTIESNVGDSMETVEDESTVNKDHQQSAILAFGSHVGKSIEMLDGSQYQDTSADRKSKDEEECSTGDTNDKKNQKHFQYKEKMYPDLENVDIFEDKFDKIKRKYRSQAAAAKQLTSTLVSDTSGQISEAEEVRRKKKSDKKKVKKNSKKICQSTVLTKGALKGFDGVKISIPTSTIVQIHETTKKKRKKSSKKKRDKKATYAIAKDDNDDRNQQECTSQKKVDVYEFMDNEEAELLELRPSTVMERFKNIHYESIPSTSKHHQVVNEPEDSSDSASDGDDFVYMSDDYVASEEETENSLLSEIGNVKGETNKKAVAQSKRKATEKNAVMGKIFKHNAVRTEKKSVKILETVKPQANLDQLFDRLLKDDPVEDIESNKKEHSLMSPKYEELTSQSLSPRSEKKAGSVTLSQEMYDYPSPRKDIKPRLVASAIPKSDVLSMPSTSKRVDDSDLLSDDFNSSPTDDETLPPKKHDVLTNKYDSDRDEIVNQYLKSRKIKKNEKRLPASQIPLGSDSEIDSIPLLEDTGVAIQRARRKCTVGKQNILAETWSSESEAEGGPHSAVSGAPTSHRKKKIKKAPVGGRRGGNKQVPCKKVDLTCGANEEWTMRLAEELEAEEQARREREQHGWIVGGSHKKLVTLLAHAKGRNRNDQLSLE